MGLAAGPKRWNALGGEAAAWGAAGAAGWHFLGACEERGDWPEPLRAGLVVLTPRPIVLLPLIYRIWAAARRPAVRMCVVRPGADGAEEPGRGADDAAWSFALEAECLGAGVDDRGTRCSVASSWTAASATRGPPQAAR